MSDPEPTGHAAPAADSGPREDPPALVHVVEGYDDGPDECTLYPPHVSEAEVVTRWLTARGDAYVDVERMR